MFRAMSLPSTQTTSLQWFGSSCLWVDQMPLALRLLRLFPTTVEGGIDVQLQRISKGLPEFYHPSQQTVEYQYESNKLKIHGSTVPAHRSWKGGWNLHFQLGCKLR
mmetsp:Transcript_27064/g.71341  ORF Transcript_27064/g.71341 Transcript_27064/m.71341 type:complete len:106 (-) Transcript_27064:423-740(-)